MTAVHNFRPLPPELAEIQVQMEGHAASYGLDFFPTIFEVVDHDQLNAVAAYGGFPTRYPHWRFGMEYAQLSKSYSYGLSKIYELVINNNPCYAYLLASNGITDHKLVMAHVYGHCDFFKNNEWFRQTNRKMIDEMANHGNRIRRYMDRFGVEEVENFIDLCLSIEDLIDIHAPFIRRRDATQKYDFRANTDEQRSPQPQRFQSKSYMDSFVNPPAALKKEAERLQEQDRQREGFPAEPTRDVMLFILENAPLKPWQADVLAIIRDEAYYFAPQAQTKIMNEGWATYWHSTIMTRHGIEPNDLICYADHCAGTLAGSRTRLNPYKLGVELFRDIEDRWNRGCYGEDYERCDDMRAKQEWNTHAGLGREKIFEVRRIHNDLTFIDEFLTLEFCRRHQLFQFGFNDDSGYYEIESRKFDEVKQQLLFNLTNRGRPQISVVDGNFRNRGELLLEHTFVGVELKMSYAHDTLKNMYSLWGRPVSIRTVLDDTVTLLGFDGAENSLQQMDELLPEDDVA
ncbi:SpoVR family protein [Lignipirellula cremea]|uniref:SpoVR family protein n=1 Tax=Lignipirellula cremea TaxID=2528010 RepID=A0A518DUI6_9BACT|nr:SpoVR family protein [Lignipirellula cremea]QDU95501.1 SpoVR family protein [Lignipirellula cremea]